jgi:hypothetical protein
MGARLQFVIAVGMIGAIVIWLFPPFQRVERRCVLVEGPPEEKVVSLHWVETDEVVDSSASVNRWRWDPPAERWDGSHYRLNSIRYEVHSGRLVAQLGIWAAIVYLAIVLGRRNGRRPQPPIHTASQLIAMMVSGFAVGKAELSLAVDAMEKDEISRRLQSSDSRLLIEYAWKESDLILAAVVFWATNFLLGLAVVLAKRSTRAKQEWRAAEGRNLDWVRAVQPWPREHWLGGPARSV